MDPFIQQKRDAALDNLKGLLIISVVYVHMYDMLGQKTPLLYTIRLVVLAVQMPLFLFLCGYFGKHVEKRRRTALTEYLIPFLLFNTLYYIIRSEQVPELEYGLFRPLNMYWFLLTLLIIRMLMPELLRVRGLLPLSIVVALLAGGDPYLGRTLSLSRTICFFPFYLLGYCCTPTHMKRIRRLPVPAVLLCGGAGAFFALWLTDTLHPDKSSSHPFQLVNSYEAQGLEPFEGIAFRLSIYLIAPLLGMMLLRLIPAGKGILTRIGRGSMTVYLLHAFPMLWIVEHWEWLCGLLIQVFPALEQYDYPGQLDYGIPQLALLLIYAFVVSLALSSPFVTRIYNRTLSALQHMLFYAAPGAKK